MSSSQSAQSANPSGSNAASGSTRASSASVSIPATAAAGGVTILQPANSAAASFYKIAQNEFITFKWNLTSL